MSSTILNQQLKKEFNIDEICLNNDLLSLESILASRDDDYMNFVIYLQHTYCIENLYFWQDVQIYKSTPSFDKYQSMIQNYIIPDSPFEINIPCEMRQQLLTQFSPNCFDEAAETILELIRINSFLPWYHHRRSPSTSFSEPYTKNSCQINRPSFSSVRSPSNFSIRSYQSISHKITDLFQSKKHSFFLKLKNKFHSSPLYHH